MTPPSPHSTLRFHGNCLELSNTVGEGGEGTKIPFGRGSLKGGGRDEEVMVCGDVTICLKPPDDPECDTTAWGVAVASHQLCVQCTVLFR